MFNVFIYNCLAFLFHLWSISGSQTPRPIVYRGFADTFAVVHSPIIILILIHNITRTENNNLKFIANNQLYIIFAGTRLDTSLYQ